MYRYTKEAMDAAEAAAGAAPAEPPQPSRSEQGSQDPAAACNSAQEPNTQENCAYELRGIVVHSGTANAGHYYSYAKVGPASSGAQDGAASSGMPADILYCPVPGIDVHACCMSCIASHAACACPVLARVLCKSFDHAPRRRASGEATG